MHSGHAQGSGEGVDACNRMEHIVGQHHWFLSRPCSVVLRFLGASAPRAVRPAIPPAASMGFPFTAMAISFSLSIPAVDQRRRSSPPVRRALPARTAMALAANTL
eukprot:scaffold324_cov326-Pavlova_lutheri.AAC.55